MAFLFLTCSLNSFKYNVNVKIFSRIYPCMWWKQRIVLHRCDLDHISSCGIKNGSPSCDGPILNENITENTTPTPPHTHSYCELVHCLRHLHHRPPLGRKPLSKITACNLHLIAPLREICMLLHYIIRFVPAYFSVFLSALQWEISFVFRLWGDILFFVVSKPGLHVMI